MSLSEAARRRSREAKRVIMLSTLEGVVSFYSRGEKVESVAALSREKGDLHYSRTS